MEEVPEAALRATACIGSAVPSSDVDAVTTPHGLGGYAGGTHTVPLIKPSANH